MIQNISIYWGVASASPGGTSRGPRRGREPLHLYTTGPFRRTSSPCTSYREGPGGARGGGSWGSAVSTFLSLIEYWPLYDRPFHLRTLLCFWLFIEVTQPSFHCYVPDYSLKSIKSIKFQWPLSEHFLWWWWLPHTTQKRKKIKYLILLAMSSSSSSAATRL